MAAADHCCARSRSNDQNEYRPRNPEDSLLYRTIAAHLETFLARQQERGREVPQFIEREMRAYLSCGVLACGFLRLKCESCGKGAAPAAVLQRPKRVSVLLRTAYGRYRSPLGGSRLSPCSGTPVGSFGALRPA